MGEGRGEGHGHRPRSRDYDWSDEDAERFLHGARRQAEERYPSIARLVAENVHREEPVVLDLGCGPALLLEEVAQVLPRARLVGVDPSQDMLQLASRVLERAGPGTYELLEGAAEAIPLEDGSVDVVVSLKGLHEWQDAPRGMAEVARVLVAGGVLILRDANKAYPYWRLRLLTWYLRMTRGRLATRGYLGPYRDAYLPEEVEAFLEGAGLQVLHAERRAVELLYVARKVHLATRRAADPPPQ